MTAINKRKLITLAIGAMMMASRKKKPIKQKQIRRFWTRGIFKDRELHSEYYTLYQELRERDREFNIFFAYISIKRK